MNKDFIQSSRKFVCVRLETYESEEYKELMRTLAGGKLANTTFCILKPDGETKITSTGRSPSMVLTRGFRVQSDSQKAQSEAKVVAEMNKISAIYPAKSSSSTAIVQDFHSFKQSLNVASGDQRLLTFVVAPESQRSSLKKHLAKVANNKDIIGKFHFDFADKNDAQWSEVVTGDKNKTGIFIIQSGQFGLDGSVLKELPLDASSYQIYQALRAANREFASTEKRKVYSEHVKAGRRAGINYQTDAEAGEDKNGDGKVDPKPERRRGPRH